MIGSTKNTPNINFGTLHVKETKDQILKILKALPSEEKILTARFLISHAVKDHFKIEGEIKIPKNILYLQGKLELFVTNGSSFFPMPIPSHSAKFLNHCLRNRELSILAEFTFRDISFVLENINKYRENDFLPLTLQSLNLSCADLSGTNLRGKNLRETKMNHALLYHADLSGADLSESDLSGADLSFANLSQANLKEANLAGAKLAGAILTGATLQKTNLEHANLECANLASIDLKNKTYLTKTNLKKANLHKVNLTGAILIEPDLSGANLLDLDLSDATFTKGKFDMPLYALLNHTILLSVEINIEKFANNLQSECATLNPHQTSDVLFNHDKENGTSVLKTIASLNISDYKKVKISLIEIFITFIENKSIALKLQIVDDINKFLFRNGLDDYSKSEIIQKFYHEKIKSSTPTLPPP